ncbi:hypothetical protein F511_29067 [Dorcoceras hygrometricum]|uniref:Myb-like domain-containing protein n=1 Tax=Dorcoceras hygrometricum TaxID=472368 RepID=A0A2Z7CXC4_9LAMI|nr:hypothetical protein F511_29067 [Dorcoceras hygrometricum]
MAAIGNPPQGLGEYNSVPTNMEFCAAENEVAGNTGGGGGFLRHDPGIALVWTPKEQSILEDLLSRYGKDDILVQYAKIARALPDKTIRDVAFRCRWLSEKEIANQRKDDQNSSEKNKEEKEYVTDSMPTPSQATDGYNSMMTDRDDGTSYKMIDDAVKLLEQNAQALNQIFANISDPKMPQMHENIRLFYQARLNILSILNDSGNMTETMKQMPPLPVQLNEELATAILPLSGSSYMPEITKQMHCRRPGHDNSQRPPFPN